MAHMKYRSSSTRDGNDPWIDTYPYWDECEKDDRWIFKTDMSMELNESYNSCTPGQSHQILDEVTWYFEDHESSIVVDGIPYNIEQRDRNTMVLTTVSPNFTYQARITFRH